MEANREEALRAKEIAEQKFYAKDVVGAKKFALKAQNLFPTLEGIIQMIATLDVYLADAVKINGESDWYAILSTSAFADEETVKKQFRKLALQLHPDKNKSVGAEGAFKLISEAWRVLSDKSKKMVYDQKRSMIAFQQKASKPKREDSVPTNGFYNFANNTFSDGRKARKSTAKPNNTFWTSCNRCRMQYEYLRVYLNHNLLCPNCHEAFLATETGCPANAHNASHPHRQNSNNTPAANNDYGSTKNQCAMPGMGNPGSQHGTNAGVYTNPEWTTFSGTAGTETAAASPSGAAELNREEMLHKKNRTLKRNFSGSQSYDADINGKLPDQEQLASDRPAKRNRSNGEDIRAFFGWKGTEGSAYKAPFADKWFNYNASCEMGRDNVTSADSSKARLSVSDLRRVLARTDFRGMLMEKATAGIGLKLKEWNPTAAAATLAEKEKADHKQKLKGSDHVKAATSADVEAVNQNLSDDSRSGKQIPLNKNLSDGSGTGNETIQRFSLDVPDPDFHDFDKDRSERSFRGDQVWATYDNEDGMPRLYAFVQKVISLKPFKVRMSFLTSKSNSELGPLNWVASGFAKTCGDFRIGRYEISDTVNIFSHRVNWEKGPRGVIRILPRKGDTWALYKNWKPDWNELTADDVIYKYDMVEVLDDYTDAQGVSVAPLVKVTGFKTVFCRHLDPKEIRRIPREEMFRFSHQVPSYVLTGEEANNAPKGCRELDPAATTLELLRVLTEVKDEEKMETAEQQNTC